MTTMTNDHRVGRSTEAKLIDEVDAVILFGHGFGFREEVLSRVT